MSRLLFDTNIVLDVLLERKPHFEASAAVWAAAESGNAEGMIAAHAVTTIHYLLRRERGNAKTTRIVSIVLRAFKVAAVDGAVVEDALRLPFSDFEDAVTAAAAKLAGCDYLVTRDPRGFRGSPVRALAPEALLPLL